VLALSALPGHFVVAKPGVNGSSPMRRPVHAVLYIGGFYNTQRTAVDRICCAAALFVLCQMPLSTG